MAMAIEPSASSRFTDVSDEPVDHLLSPIKGYENKPLVTLAESVKPIAGFFNEIEDYVYVALHNCQNSADDLTQDESASIHLYTMQFHGGPSLYRLLNQSLRAENRVELVPWFSFLKLFLTALHKLPSQSKTIWRGVKNVNLSAIYKTGTKVAWWGVSSCTTCLEILESKKFLDKHGHRTLFSIECINGKCIANHSYFKDDEKEMILMPGSYFEVISQINPAPKLHIIHLKEIAPPITFVKLPFDKSINTNPPSVVYRSRFISRLLSKVLPKSTSSGDTFEEVPWQPNIKWKQMGITLTGKNGFGNQLNQLSLPFGMFIDDDQTMYIADYGNDRIVEWKSNASIGHIVAGGNGRGNQTSQLNGPRDVIIDKENNSFIIADRGNRRVMRWPRQKNTTGEILISDIDCRGITMDRNGFLYVSDIKKNEVRRWKRGDQNETIVAGGNGEGAHLNQLNWPTYIFVDEDDSLYVSDSWNHRVMKWVKDAEEGIVVAGGNNEGNSLIQLSSPRGLVVDQLGQIYVADSGNHRVMRWCQGSKEGTIVVGGNGRGKQSKQLNVPTGLSFDRQGNLYVVDSGNYRIQKFEIDENEYNFSK